MLRNILPFKVVLLCSLIALFFWNAEGYAQTPAEIKWAKKIFGGPWVDKKTTRHLRIFIEKDEYATINDWTSKFQKQESGDAYKAIIRNGKLIMYEDHEFHAPYSEISIQNNRLVYMTRYKSYDGKTIIEKQFFVREPW
jgi:hypothetical protein